MQKTIHHFSHPNHSLRLYKGDRKPWNSSGCVICKYSPSEYWKKWKKEKQEQFIYGCRECRFIIHLDCAKLPQELIHPFHLCHPLALYHVQYPFALYNVQFYEKECFPCHACGSFKNFDSYIYRCTENDCKFSLDIGCSHLQPLNNDISNDYDDDDRLMISHQHPVFVCNQPTNFNSLCNFCRSSFSKTDLIYVCVDCKHLMHKSCVFPHETTHPFHLEHPLVLATPPVSVHNDCNACSKICTSYFTCSECNFFLDLSCIHLKPTGRSSETKHQHSVIQCNPMKMKDQPPCAGCESAIKDSVYVCLVCGILLDEFCSTQLLPEIKSPFHPLHPLTLVKHNKPRDCVLCYRGTNLLMYVCEQCNYVIDSQCAASVKPYAVVNSTIHEHSLAFMIKKPSVYDWKKTCKTCFDECDKYFFICTECYYCIHLQCCLSLPKVIKHDSHCDPLIFTNSLIKDASDEDSENEELEFYCHACEELRDLADSTYYCRECHFVAHLHCVFPAILQALEAEPHLTD